MLPWLADLFLFCFERDFMMCLSDDKQADIIVAMLLMRLFGRYFKHY